MSVEDQMDGEDFESMLRLLTEMSDLITDP